MNEQFTVRPIGCVRREDEGAVLEILPAYRPGLKQLEHFSHVIVLWWFTGYDNDESRATLQARPPYAEDHMTGVFAMRSEYRPNPIGLTTCPILAVDEAAGTVHVANIDAYEGTPILDLKGYFPVFDRVESPHIPPWLEDMGMPEWLPDFGMGIWEDEEA
ncbi:MAG: tRNA (N6-threonylcarbamoyladenosine(37)-N6)-methyltransferase TrmO [Anaerolineae bacterium]|nr:tRNA (N6-threonylcarbamoyladenosine(37)-N6)-methyltransferase TrmO [Anaerolineae bacterium]